MSKYKAKTVFHSFKYAFHGIFVALKSQRNVRIDFFASIAALFIGFYLNISPIEFCIVLLVISLVITAEFLNTIVEFIVDAYFGNEYSILPKMSKDIAAGMVLISAIISLIIGGIIFLPKVL